MFRQQREVVESDGMFRKILVRKKLRAARTSFTERKFEEALAHADDILRNDPHNLKAMLLRIKALERIGREIKKMMDSIVEIHGHDDEAVFQLARLSYNTGDYGKCEELCKLIQTRTEDYQSKLLLARTNAKLKRKRLSLEMMDEIINSNLNDDSLSWAARVAYEMRDVIRMRKYLDVLIELSGESETTRNLQIKLNRISGKKYAISLTGSTLNETELAIDFIKTALDNGLSQVALQIASTMTISQSKNTTFMSIYADAILKNKKTDLARGILNSENIDHDPIMKARLMILCGQYESAIKLLNSMTDDDSQEQNHRLLSLVHSRTGNLSLSIEHDRIALKKNKKDVISRHRLFVNLLQSDKMAELDNEWQKIMAELKEDNSMLETAWYISLRFAHKKWIFDVSDHLDGRELSLDLKIISFKSCMEHGRLDLALKYMDLIRDSNLEEEEKSSFERKFSNLLSDCEVDEEELRSLANKGEVYTLELIVSAICREVRKSSGNAIWWEEDPVVHISSTLGKGGAEKQLIELACRMKKDNPLRKVIILVSDVNSPANDSMKLKMAEDAGVDVISFDTGLQIDSVNSHGVLGRYRSKVHRLPNASYINKIENLAMLLTKIKPGIVHSWQDQTNLLVGMVSSMIGVSRTILSCRSLPPRDKGMNHSRNNIGLIAAYIEYLKDPRISIVHNSVEGMERYKELMGLEIDSISMPVNGNMTSIPKKKNFNSKKEELVIGGVFRLTPEKNPLQWIRIAERVLNESPTSVQFVLVGGGRMFDEVKSRIEQSPHNNNIKLLGEIDEIDEMYSDFDLLLHVSNIEGLPNVILESQSHGIPIICTNAGGSKSAFLPSVSGLLVEIGDIDGAVENLLFAIADKKWRVDASTAGIDFIRENFSIEKIFSQWISIYRNEDDSSTEVK